MSIYHYEKVDQENIQEKFTNDRKHRCYLSIPFLNKDGDKTLCVIGQNPSKASKKYADRTVLYLEKFVCDNLPKYSSIIILNLFTIVDTTKNQDEDLTRTECAEMFEKILNEMEDFLVVYGKIENEGSYSFVDKAKSLKTMLKDKSVFKIDIGSDYAPHPRNPLIHFSNYSLNLTPYYFEDIN